ncbi:MAG: hypothetical protein Q9196_007414, partial [Gyalolechia fulgens]
TTSPSLLPQPQGSSSSPIRNTTNEVSSPLFAALGTYPATEDISQLIYPAREWADGFSLRGSPLHEQNNGFSLASSPPSARPFVREPPGGPRNASLAPSPPNTYARPIRRASGHQSLGGYPGSSPAAERPMSMPSRTSPSQNPALPHHPQAHFYGAPEIDLGKPDMRRPGQGALNPGCCVFDNLSMAGSEGFRGADSVLLVGLQNRLDIFNIEKGRLDLIGRLGDLRGTVIGAQLLPSLIRDDPARSLRPLVAVIVHGPQRDQRPKSRPNTSQHDDDALFDPSASVLQVLESAENTKPDPSVRYQTTIEVYSLAKNEHIATLLSGPAIETTLPQNTSHPTGPPPDGDWRIKGCGRFLVVTSGKSGEVFLFECAYGSEKGSLLAFRCI